MAQLMPLPLTVSCFSKIQIGFTCLVPAHLGSPRKRDVKRMCVCVCVCVIFTATDDVTERVVYKRLGSARCVCTEINYSKSSLV